ncbi:MAG: GspH/FimT family pseudopilin [Pseudomonadota bacterium]|nr:GspH/FimT family pseudopilin [Pseudomonadota bacterium]
MNKKTTKGMTLIELVVAVAIFAVLASLAVPNLKSFMRSNRLTSATNDLASSLNMVRSEAVKRSTSIKLCISDANQSDCNTGSTSWEDGWLAFIDSNDDDAIDSGETVLRVHAGPGGGTTLRSEQFPSTITFNSDGSAEAIGSFRICDEEANAQRARGINITNTGNISAAKDTDSDDIRNIYTGTSTWGEISCP